jgi:hypothetical protein
VTVAETAAVIVELDIAARGGHGVDGQGERGTVGLEKKEELPVRQEGHDRGPLLRGDDEDAVASLEG